MSKLSRDRQAPRKPPLRFQPSGVTNLDQILGGGLPRGALVLIVGMPGSGKTTMANQMAFANARTGRRSLVLTALSEGTGKLIEHLRTYTFFQEDLIGDAVQFLSVQQFLDEGLKAASVAIMRMARQMRADIVLLDGFRGMLGIANDTITVRQFLYELGTSLGALGMLTIITSETELHDPTLYPEMAIADVLINLHYSLHNTRHHRALEVVKARGAQPFPGLHHMTLDDAGAVVYPQLEVRSMQMRAESPPAMIKGNGRAAFGLPELDDILEGGIPQATSTLLVGSVGTGKTLLSLYFALAGVQASEATLYVSLRENPQRIQRFADRFALGPGLQAAQKQADGLTLSYISPILLNPDQFADQLIQQLDRTQARRLIIDSIAEVERALNMIGMAERREEFFIALITILQQRGITALFIRETQQTVSSELAFTNDALAVLAENVLLLQQVSYRGHLRRLLSVIKMRFSGHDTSLHELRIAAATGFAVLTPGESETTFLAEMTMQQERYIGRARASGTTEKADEA